MQISEEEEEEAYGCRDCRFFLHEACAKPPLVLKHHPFHPEHHLHLHYCPPGPNYLRCLLYNQCTYRRDETGDPPECHMCRTQIIIGYSCRNCEFFLDLSCAIGAMPCEEADDEERKENRGRSPVTNHSLHPHQLSSYHSKTQTKFRCRICFDKIQSGDFFGCSDCKFFLHESCAQPPMDVIQHYFHPEHTLTYARIPDEKKQECPICEFRPIGDSYGYTCEMCDFFIHRACVSAFLSDLEKGAGMTVQCSFHEHELKLYYNDYISKKCRACRSTISRETAAYKCFSQGCKFKLHKSCAQLASELEHPSHSLHPLTLCFKPPNEDDDIRCPCCYRKISGHFAFSCGECNFYLHVDCAQKPTLTHPFHDHILFFSCFVGKWPNKFSADNFRCRACLKTCSFNLFRCWQCNFNLHYECSQFPPTYKSEHHCDQLVLRQSYTEDEYGEHDASGEYYCDFCERRRDPNKWIYFCDMGTYKLAAHIECALSPVKLEVIEEDDIITRNEDIQRRKEKIKLEQEQVDAEEEEKLKPLLAKLESKRAELESKREELKELETERAKWIDMEAIEEDKSIRREESGNGSTDGEEDSA